MIAVRRGVAIGAVVLLLASLSVAAAHHRVIRGRVHYYSNELIGATMACGGRYQPDKLIAAHRTLPCGTRLRVKNVANGRRVTVTVKDRGPYGDKDYVLDVSRRAAKRLRFLRAGSARVRAVILHD